MLHIFLTPAPYSVKNILSIKLHGNHHTIRHTLGTNIMILYISDVCHTVTYLKINFVWPIKDFIKYILQLVINLFVAISHFSEQVSITVSLECTFIPWHQMSLRDQRCCTCTKYRTHNDN